jgi:hypothetical protein
MLLRPLCMLHNRLVFHLPNLRLIQDTLSKSLADANGTRNTVAIAVGLEEV